MTWTILVYHDVGWEETPWTRGITGLVCPPDLFREHVRWAHDRGRIVSVEEGLERTESGERGTLFSFWFDDGFSGVRKYAFPVLEELGVKGAVSVLSGVLLRTEFPWRMKLSRLRFADGGRFLRTRLRRCGFRPGMSLARFTLDGFSPEVAEVIDRTYRELVPDREREAGWRIFDTLEGFRELGEAGWTLANHGVRHWPVGEETTIDFFETEFTQCESALKELTGEPARFAVIPFDRGSRRSPLLTERFEKWRSRGRNPCHLVLLGNRRNRMSNLKRGIIWRVTAPAAGTRALARALRFL